MFSWSRPPSTLGRSDSTPNPSQTIHSNTTTTTTTTTTTQIKNRYSRQQHIDSYVNDALLKPSTRMVKRDEIFETVFQTKNHTVLFLRVHLPLSSFSSSHEALLQPPSLSLIGVRATHPWIDSTMKVIHVRAISSVDSWNACGFLLGKVVKDVVQHFQLNPPTVLEIVDPNIQKMQPSMVDDGNRNKAVENTNSSPLVKKLPSIQLPPTYEQYVRSMGSISSDSKKTDEIISLYMPSTSIPDYFPELDSLQKQELERLDTDIQFLLEFIQTLPLVQTTIGQKASIEEENRKDAQRNLDLQEEVSQLSKDVSTLQQTIIDKISIHEGLQQKIMTMTQPKDIQDVIQQLHKGRRSSFIESETLAKNISDFPNHVEEFMELRTLHHIRAAKIERLQHGSTKK